MLPQNIKDKVQSLWNTFRNSGMMDGLVALEQISYLLFLRWLEKADEYDNVVGKKRKSIFDGHEQCLWTNFCQLEAEKMVDSYKDVIFPFLKSVDPEYIRYVKYLDDAKDEITKPALKYDAVQLINDIFDDVMNEVARFKNNVNLQGDV